MGEKKRDQCECIEYTSVVALLRVRLRVGSWFSPGGGECILRHGCRKYCGLSTRGRHQGVTQRSAGCYLFHNYYLKSPKIKYRKHQLHFEMCFCLIFIIN